MRSNEDNLQFDLKLTILIISFSAFFFLTIRSALGKKSPTVSVFIDLIIYQQQR